MLQDKQKHTISNKEGISVPTNSCIEGRPDSILSCQEYAYVIGALVRNSDSG